MMSDADINAKILTARKELKKQNLARYYLMLERMKEDKKYEIKINEHTCIRFKPNQNAFVLAGDGLSDFLPFCPYEGCDRYTGAGWACDHYYHEYVSRKIGNINNQPKSRESTVRNNEIDIGTDPSNHSVANEALFPAGEIKSEAIKKILDLAATRYGIEDRSDPDSHYKLCYHLGRQYFYNDEMGIIVSQNGEHSMSIKIQTTYSTLTVITCARPGCNNAGCQVLPPHRYCLAHCVKQGSLGYRWHSRATSNVTQLMFDKIMEKINIRRQPEYGWAEWVKALRYIFTKGTTGEAMDIVEQCFVLSITDTLRLRLSLTNARMEQHLCVFQNCHKPTAFKLEKKTTHLITTTRDTILCKKHQNEVTTFTNYVSMIKDSVIEPFIGRSNTYGCDANPAFYDANNTKWKHAVYPTSVHYKSVATSTYNRRTKCGLKNTSYTEMGKSEDDLVNENPLYEDFVEIKLYKSDLCSTEEAEANEFSDNDS